MQSSNNDSVFVRAQKTSFLNVNLLLFHEKIIASSDLILQVLIRQTQVDFGRDSPYSGEGRLENAGLKFTFFNCFAVKCKNPQTPPDVTSEVGGKKNTHFRSLCHPRTNQFTNAVTARQSRKSWLTAAIKCQCAPSPLTCFLLASCALLLRGLPQMSDS